MVGKMLRRRRKEIGKTLREVGQEVGRHLQTVSHWERTGEVPKAMVPAIAAAYDLKESELEEAIGVEDGHRQGQNLVDSWESYQEWRVAMLSSDLSDDERLIHAAIDTFLLPGDWSAGFTLDELTPRTGLSRERIDELWPKILDSPWLHRPFTAEWVFKLRFAV